MEPLLFWGKEKPTSMAKQLFNLPDRAVQQWKSFKVDEQEFDLSHLDALKITFTHPKRDESYTLFSLYRTIRSLEVFATAKKWQKNSCIHTNRTCVFSMRLDICYPATYHKLSRRYQNSSAITEVTRVTVVVC